MKKFLTAFHLKVIAVTAMLINHLGHMLELETVSPLGYLLTETVGKLTFPIMAYLLVEGFGYSKNRSRYALRLAIFCLLSALPFHALLQPDQPLLPTNNILYTLLIGLLLLMVLERTEEKELGASLTCFFALLTFFSDWAVVGIFTIAGFYQNRSRDNGFVRPILWLTALSILLCLLTFAMTGDRLLLLRALSMLGLLLVIPLLRCYNGQLGSSSVWIKWGFYAFYPLHLCFLLLLRLLLFGR